MSTAQQRKLKSGQLRIEIRLATVDDVLGVTEAAMQLFLESPTYLELFKPNPQATAKYLESAIRTGAVPHIIALLNDKIIGVISYSLDGSFSDFKCAVLGELCVSKEYRGTPVGRALVMSAFTLAKAEGAVAMHIPIAGGHEAVPTLRNMLKKFGAEEIGIIMRKVL